MHILCTSALFTKVKKRKIKIWMGNTFSTGELIALFGSVWKELKHKKYSQRELQKCSSKEIVCYLGVPAIEVLLHYFLSPQWFLENCNLLKLIHSVSLTLLNLRKITLWRGGGGKYEQPNIFTEYKRIFLITSKIFCDLFLHQTNHVIYFYSLKSVTHYIARIQYKRIIM